MIKRIYFNRGEVLSKTVRIDNLLNITLSRYFNKKEYSKIQNWIFENDSFSFGAKIKLFFDLKIAKLNNQQEGEYKKLFNKLRTIRNAFAHGYIQHEDNGTDVLFFKEGGKDIVKPALELQDSFNKAYEKLEKFLRGIKKVYKEIKPS